MESTLFNNFIDFVSDNNLFDPRDKLLLACSGGLDSSVLFHFLIKGNFQFEVAHVNYNLREQDSIDDAAFVELRCKEHQVVFHKKNIEANYHPKSNIQNWARTVRYEFFAELDQKRHYHSILTAHHSDDLIETFLLQFARGSGLKGLSGPAIQNNKICRPLLVACRTDILSYAKNNKIAWREDVSNESIKYDRNKIRHTILPHLSAIRGHKKGMLASIANIQQSNKLLNELLDKQFNIQANQAGEFEISLEQVHSYEQAEQVLFHLISPFDFNINQVAQIIKTETNNKYMLSKTHELLYFEKRLFIRKIVQKAAQILQISKADIVKNTLIGTVECSLIEAPDSIQYNDINSAYFNIDVLDFPLCIRTWKKSETMAPFGMKGKMRKIVDILSDKKLNRFQRTSIKILVDKNDQVLWIIGIRRTNNFAITVNSGQLVRFKTNIRTN